jgi:hypothetical protein
METASNVQRDESIHRHRGNKQFSIEFSADILITKLLKNSMRKIIVIYCFSLTFTLDYNFPEKRRRKKYEQKKIRQANATKFNLKNKKRRRKQQIQYLKNKEN